MPDRRGGPGQPFPTEHRCEDVLLLAETDELHGSLSGPATLAIPKRQWQVIGDACLATIIFAGLTSVGGGPPREPEGRPVLAGCGHRQRRRQR